MWVRCGSESQLSCWCVFSLLLEAAFVFWFVLVEAAAAGLLCDELVVVFTTDTLGESKVA